MSRKFELDCLFNAFCGQPVRLERLFAEQNFVVFEYNGGTCPGAVCTTTNEAR